MYAKLFLVFEKKLSCCDQPPEEWEFEIDIKPQLFALMESDFWEPKAVEPFAPISVAKSEGDEWMNEILQFSRRAT